MKDFSEIKRLFHHLSSPQQRYEKIIELGRKLPPIPPQQKIPANIVKGCQSVVYLYAENIDGKMFYHAASDALISSGLAALLLLAYNGASPEVVLKEKPLFLEDLQIYASLSPGRSNGLANMYFQMQKSALKFLATV